MPEMTFSVRWPDGAVQHCYSPSTIINNYLQSGEHYPVASFLQKAETALLEASERVRARFGYSCSSAMDQLQQLKSKVEALPAHLKGGEVIVLDVKLRVSESPPASQKVRTKHYPVCVIGGGQAGLSISYLLKQAGIEHIVLEKNAIAHSWRSERWDSFCLVTPNYQCRLPGFNYDGQEPNGFMVKDEIVSFLERYAASFQPPIVTGVSVEQITRENGVLTIQTSAGKIQADQVVLAIGGYHTPKVPPYATALPTSITQIHSRDYKNPEQLPSGEVLVVGSGQSGCQIVEDLMIAGRKVHLVVGDAPRCARSYRGKDVVEWLEMMGHYEIPIDHMPDPAAARAKTNHYVTGRDGGHDLDLREFARQGLSLYGTLTGYQDGELTFAPNLRSCLDAADDTYRRINVSIDEYIEKNGIEAPPGSVYQPVWSPQNEPTVLALSETNITSIVWSIGFAPAFEFLKLPVLDERGHPLHERGVSPEPDVFFLGLPWQHTWGSGRFCGVAKDAEFLVNKILERRAQMLSASAAESAYV